LPAWRQQLLVLLLLYRADKVIQVRETNATDDARIELNSPSIQI
jgi:hypothetical protein